MGLALFGDTFEIKDKLRDKFKPFFNRHLKKESGESAAGWVFKRDQKAELIEWLRQQPNVALKGFDPLPQTPEELPNYEPTRSGDDGDRPAKRQRVEGQADDGVDESAVAAVTKPTFYTLASKGDLHLVDMGPTYGVFGPTKGLMTRLMTLGGKLKPYLELNGVRQKGYEFQKSAVAAAGTLAELIQLVQTAEVEVAEEVAKAEPVKDEDEVRYKGYTLRLMMKLNQRPEVVTLPSAPALPLGEELEPEIFVTDYKKSIAVFGDTKPIRTILKQMGGKFNNSLTYNTKRRAGWIFSPKMRGEVEALIEKHKAGTLHVPADP
ncbi:hypothetical protein HK101_009629 [Irineochytrium annulatum]|nr:hypothetical protein HK101_009629 [Irineochytrium annulatum]